MNETMTLADCERLTNFWDDMVRSHIFRCMENPKTSIYWLFVDERDHAFDCWTKAAGLKPVKS